MQFKIAPKDLRWWTWLATLLLIASALAGWKAGYFLTISLSLVHALFYIEETKSVTDFETQIRIAYAALTLFGLIPGVRVVMFLALFAGTFIATFFDPTLFARALKRMPWNQNRAPQ
ncbi:MAG: hypothetical protein WCA17_10585 [Burkholderiales bacterium]